MFYFVVSFDANFFLNPVKENVEASIIQVTQYMFLKISKDFRHKWFQNKCNNGTLFKLPFSFGVGFFDDCALFEPHQIGIGVLMPCDLFKRVGPTMTWHPDLACWDWGEGLHERFDWFASHPRHVRDYSGASYWNDNGNGLDWKITLENYNLSYAQVVFTKREMTKERKDRWSEPSMVQSWEIFIISDPNQSPSDNVLLLMFCLGKPWNHPTLVSVGDMYVKVCSTNTFQTHLLCRFRNIPTPTHS